jgi:methionyl-tRNA formyltransferase
MRVVFVTHNELGLACLEELYNLGADIEAVYTRLQRDDLADQTDLSTFAANNELPLHRVSSVNERSTKSQIKEYDPELLFVIGWSQLVDSEVLEIPSIAALGMHPAPLPRGRGRAPIAWSLIKGLDETALSFFNLVEKADAGDIIGQEPIPISIDDNATSLYQKVIKAGRRLIREYYPVFTDGTIPCVPQDNSNATWWPKRDPHHGLINWTQPPEKVYNWIRGQSRPYPGAFSYLNGEKIVIWKANPPRDDTTLAQPGEIMYQDDGNLGIGAWEGTIELTEIQVDGNKSISADLLVTEYEHSIGDVFSNARDIINK